MLQNHKEQLQSFSRELRTQVEDEKSHLLRVIEEIKQKENLIEEKLLKNEQSLYVLTAGLKWIPHEYSNQMAAIFLPSF